MAYAMPVLPEVASRIVRAVVSLPEASPSRIIRAAARSFTEPPGFCHSAFAYSSTPAGTSRSNLCRRTSGVRPIMSRTDELSGRSTNEDSEVGDDPQVGDDPSLVDGITIYTTELVLDYINP